MTEEAYCCFCYTLGRQVDMFCLVIYPPGEKLNERTQTVLCHGICLDRALHPEMWRHPDLLDDDKDVPGSP